MNVKGGSDTDHQFTAKAINHLGHKSFLFRRAQSHPDNIWRESCNRLFQLDLFLKIKRPKRRSKRSHDPDTWKPLPELSPKLLSDTRFAAVKEMRISIFQRTSAHSAHEVRTKYASHSTVLLQSAYPNHRGAVGCNQEGPIENLAELRTPLGLHHAVHTGDTHVARRS